jgi:hypothetical protein
MLDRLYTPFPFFCLGANHYHHNNNKNQTKRTSTDVI